MFTLDADRRIPSIAEPDGLGVLHPTEVAQVITRSPGGDVADPSSDDITEILLCLVQDLDKADTAIKSGRIEDAHRALIHAQDVAFERHLALVLMNPRRPGKRPTDFFLHLANRLIDANRFKDRAIIAECRSLLDLLVETCAAGRPTLEPTPS